LAAAYALSLTADDGRQSDYECGRIRRLLTCQTTLNETKTHAKVSSAPLNCLTTPTLLRRDRSWNCAAPARNAAKWTAIPGKKRSLPRLVVCGLYNLTSFAYLDWLRRQQHWAYCPKLHCPWTIPEGRRWSYDLTWVAETLTPGGDQVVRSTQTWFESQRFHHVRLRDLICGDCERRAPTVECLLHRNLPDSIA